MTTKADPIKALHLADVGPINADIRANGVGLSTHDGRGGRIHVTITVPACDVAGYPVVPTLVGPALVSPGKGKVWVFCSASAEYDAVVGALRAYVDAYAGEIHSRRAALVALMDSIEGGER